MLWPVDLMWSAMADECSCLVRALKCSVFLSCTKTETKPFNVEMNTLKPSANKNTHPPLFWMTARQSKCAAQGLCRLSSTRYVQMRALPKTVAVQFSLPSRIYWCPSQ